MFKYFFALLVAIQFAGYASSFTSLHEGRFLASILSNKDFLNQNNSLTLNKEYTLIQHTKKTKSGEYYHPNGWLHFKYYVPAGTSVRFVLSSMPNTSMRIDLKFRADHNNIINHLEPLPNPIVYSAKDDPLYGTDQPTVEHIAINTFNQIAYDMDEGGWVYVSIVENSAENEGDHGYIDSSTLIVNYTIEIIDKEKFKKWLYATTFLRPGGDPVDVVDHLEEYDRILDGSLKNIKRVITLNPDGNYTLDQSTDVFTTPPHYSVESPVSTDPQENSDENYEVVDSPAANQPKTTTVSNPTKPMVPENNLSEEQKQTIASLKSKTLPISGYFVHVGDDWIYVSNKTKDIYKLEGLQEDGKFKWLKIPNLVPIVTGTEIRFVSNDSKVSSPASGQDGTEGSSNNKNCPSGYSYDPEAGYCVSSGGNVEASHSSTPTNQPNSTNNVLPVNIPTAQSSSTSRQKSCPSGYVYDPEVGYCVAK